MQIREEELRSRYESLSSDILIDLARKGTLTETASNVLNSVLSSRGVSDEQYNEQHDEVDNIITSTEKRCPECHLYNPPNAQLCDCGYDFITGKVQESYLVDRQLGAKSVSLGEALIAVLLPLIGLIYGSVLLRRGERRGKEIIFLSLAAVVIGVTIHVLS